MVSFLRTLRYEKKCYKKYKKKIKMKRKGLKTKLQFEFETDMEVPDLNYKVPLETKKANNKINIVKKRKPKDASTNINLF